MANVTLAPTMGPTSPNTLVPTLSPATPYPTPSPTPSPVGLTPAPTSAEQWMWHNEYSGAVLSEYTAIVWGVLAIITVYFIRRYANPWLFRHHTYITVFVAYFCSFGIILLAPTDIALTLIGRRENSVNLAEKTSYELYNGVTLTLYNILFWPCILMGSVVMPFQEYYNKDGHFTPVTRFIGTLKSLAKTYFIYGVIGGICIGILIGGGYFESIDAISATAKALSNTGGLIAIVLLLGYGMVEFPRSLWTMGNLEQQHLLAQADAAVAFKDFSEVSLKCSMTVADVVKTCRNAEKMNNERYIRCCREIMLDCPKEFRGGHSGTSLGLINIDTLANLRKKLRDDASNFNICKNRIERIKTRAYFFEDLLEAKRGYQLDNDGGHGRPVVEWSFGMGDSTSNEFWWYTKWKPRLQRVTSIFLGLFSFVLVLAYIGVMTGYNSHLSFFKDIVHSEKVHMGGITTFTLFSLGYMSWIIFWSLGQMRLAGMVELISDQQTTPYSLSFNARMVCRLAPAIVYSYFGLIYENGVETGEWMEDRGGVVLTTAYSKLFGEMSVLPLVGDKFNTFAPTVMIILAIFQLANLINRVLVMLRLNSFQFGTEIVDEDTKLEGRRQLLRHKKQMERAAARGLQKANIESMKRGNFFTSMFSGGGGEHHSSADAELRHIPDEITGWIEKKAPRQMKTLVMSGWQKRLFVCKAPGVLSYFDSIDTHKSPKGTLDLRIVIGIKHHVRHTGKEEKGRLDLCLADREFKLRFESEEECLRWKKSLSEWRDYAQDHGHEVGSNGVCLEDDGADGGRGEGEKDNDGGEGENVGLAKSDSMRKSSMSFSREKKKVSIAVPEDSVTERSKIRDKKRNTIFMVKEKARRKNRESLHLVSKPEKLEGDLMLRCRHSTGLYNTYKSHYFSLIPSNGILNYWSSSADVEKPALGSIDMALVLSVERKRGKGVKLEIDLGEEVMKIKCKDEAEAVRWREELIKWQEYLLLHMGEGDFGV